MSIYQNFCREVVDETGRLQSIELEYPDNFNFGYDVVDAIADKTPDKRAIVWCNVENEERIITFGELKELSNRAANVFSAAGLRKGDRVMVLLKRHYEYWIVAVALHKLGITLIPATNMLTVSDLVYRLEASQAKGIICTPSDGVAQKVKDAVEETKLQCKLWTVQKDDDGFCNLTKDMENAVSELSRVDTLVTDHMILYFTSGTTGYPKGVIHDFSYPLAHIATAKYWHQVEDGGLHLTIAETGWAKASWGKIYGQWLCECAVMVYDFDNFDPKQILNVINHYGVTSFCAPPTVYRYLVRKDLPDMPTLKHASTAGETLAPEVYKRFSQQTGLEIYGGYGQTETTLLIGNMVGEKPTDGSLGKVSPLYKIKLLGEDGQEVRQGEVGEVVIVPPEDGKQVGVFCGYLGNEEQYKYVWRGGVYHTGDSAWQDENGVYWFHGRFDDLIKTGGFRVGPDEIENILMEHSDVVECGVVGIPDTLRGQAIKAFIVLVGNCEPSKEKEKEIKDFCNGKLAEYKWIRSIEFVRELPKTISGKIRKTELRASGTEQ